MQALRRRDDHRVVLTSKGVISDAGSRLKPPSHQSSRMPVQEQRAKVRFPLLQDQRSIPLTCSSSDATVGGSMLDAFSRISEMIAATLLEV